MNFVNPDLKNKTNIQAKLNIGQPGDKYEQEADAMADHVMQKTNVIAPPVQMKCQDCEEEDLQMKPLSESITPIVQKQPEEEERNAPNEGL